MNKKPPSDRKLMRRVRDVLGPNQGNETFESLRNLVRDLAERLQFERMSHGFCEQERIKFLQRLRELGNSV